MSRGELATIFLLGTLLGLRLSHVAQASPARVPPIPDAGMAAEAPDGGFPDAVSARTVEIRGQTYDVVEVDPSRADIELHWKDREGAPLETYSRLSELVESRGRRLLAATNAGIFEPGLVPTGLWVEGGATLRRLNAREGSGNFYLRPNGVFYVARGGAGIVETSEYPSLEGVREATQSGPLLVRRGALHPLLSPRGHSANVRSAVGVRPDGRVVFAVSRGEVTFYELATAFRDSFGCADALYLDGFISTLWAPSLDREEDAGASYAGMIAILARP